MWSYISTSPMYIWRAQRKLCRYAREFLACVCVTLPSTCAIKEKKVQNSTDRSLCVERVKVGAVCRYTYLLTLIAGDRTDVLQYVVQSTATEAAVIRCNCHILYHTVQVETSWAAATPFLSFFPSFYYSLLPRPFFSSFLFFCFFFISRFFLVYSFLCVLYLIQFIWYI
jgi:hypothetical protein